MKYVIASWLVAQEILGAVLKFTLVSTLAICLVIVIPFLLMAHAQVYLETLSDSYYFMKGVIAIGMILYIGAVAGMLPVYTYAKARFLHHLETLDPRKQKENE